MQYAVLSSLPSAAMLLGCLLLITGCRADALVVDQSGQENHQWLFCEAEKSPDQQMLYAVYTTIDDSKLKVMDMEACAYLSPRQYAHLGIPTTALTALGGDWKGKKRYVYLIEQPPFILYYFAEWRSTAKPHFKPLLKYDGRRFEWLHPPIE